MTPNDQPTVHHLSPDERNHLKSANALLEIITEKHHHACPCEFCSARRLTDVQEETSFHVPYVPDGE